MKPIQYGITIFSGYLQRLGSPGSGMVRIQRDCELLTTHRNDVRVGLYPWNTDESDVAESLWRYRPRDEVQNHIVVGYSYGGDRAVKFVRELEKRGGCAVRGLLLCDAVRRWDYLPGVAAGFGIGRLTVPWIVDRCIWYVQKTPRWGFRKKVFQPAGHEVVAKCRTTRMTGPAVKKASHSYIDNDSGFRNSVIAAVGHLMDEAAGL